jgi:hypothetical protein
MLNLIKSIVKLMSRRDNINRKIILRAIYRPVTTVIDAGEKDAGGNYPLFIYTGYL